VIKKIICTLCVSIFSLGLVPAADAAFIGRLETFTGSGVFQAYYDDQLDITWAANPNINVSDTWDNQMAWVANLTIGGVGGWRLPNMDVNGDGDIVLECSSVSQSVCADNEYAHMTAYGAGSILGSGVTSWDASIFNLIWYGGYWSNTESSSNQADAWAFVLSGQPVGISAMPAKSNISNAWAVRSGDISAVPLPAAVWLFGGGLIGLLSVAARKKI